MASERSEEHTSELQSIMRISYAVFCVKKKKTPKEQTLHHDHRNKNIITQTKKNNRTNYQRIKKLQPSPQNIPKETKTYTRQYHTLQHDTSTNTDKQYMTHTTNT